MTAKRMYSPTIHFLIEGAYEVYIQAAPLLWKHGTFKITCMLLHILSTVVIDVKYQGL